MVVYFCFLPKIRRVIFCVCVNILPKSAENVPFDRASSVNFEKALDFFCPASWYGVGER